MNHINKPRVFVTQIPNRRDPSTGAMKPVFDILPAAEYGEIKVLMPASFSLFQTSEMIKQLRNELLDYDFVRGDCVVPTGDPAIIFSVGAVLAEQHRKIRILKWEKSVNRYVPVEVVL